MSRKRNRTRRPNAHANNRRGPRTVGFDGDHLMQVDPPLTKNRNPANRRGGNNKSFPARGRGAQPYHNGNNHAPGPRGGQGQRHHNNNASNSNPNKRKHRNNNHSNTPNTPSDLCSDIDMHLGTPPPPLPFTTSPFSASSPPFSLTHHANSNSNTHFNGGGGSGGTNKRFCTECSAVRRANLRFRNWAARAIRACGERFREWADDAGVGFESADEMDWQPEPVIRVLFVRPPSPTPASAAASYPFAQPYAQPYTGQRKPSFGTQAQGLEAEQYLEHLRQQNGVNVWEGGVGSVNNDPKPGPWPWPPFNWYENPAVPTWSARVPSTGLPGVPTTMEDVPLPDCSTFHTNPNTNAHINNIYAKTNAYTNNASSIPDPMPVSGFGLLGAGCAGCAAEEQESRLGCAWSAAGEQPSIPARAPPQAPAVTSTCGPARVGVGVGVPSARPLGANFATYRSTSRKTSRDSDGPY
ncbi:uncharacterized protein F4807DRAFT_247746 [Annulohypoxylon truncatum]|uniref:uncharacterized protein n=1 Tax=Annulohypoxylon truncatum TaxID=327061 RepID=UPI00200735FF|nr:uncharacterized protein F4807DRAFT_247746 [Annulohypoxylon truncatum]KAI1205946.1 hypothetical protein F4807DRAFT_247746 [Annulohypoxylon truncatum]